MLPQIPIHENGEPLVDLSNYPFLLSPKYFELGMSQSPRMFLRRSVADMLVKALGILPDRHRFKIWDGWRSIEVQHRIFAVYMEMIRRNHSDFSEEQLREETSKYVNPGTDFDSPPPHSTGGAVDLTIVDGADRELDMGTVFDHLGPESAPFYFEQVERNIQVRDNRRLLRSTMERVGFVIDDDEWWDFNFGTQAWAKKRGRSEAIFGAVAPGADAPVR